MAFPARQELSMKLVLAASRDPSRACRDERSSATGDSISTRPWPSGSTSSTRAPRWWRNERAFAASSPLDRERQVWTSAPALGI